MNVLDFILEKGNAKVWCESCGAVFLDTTMKNYRQVSNTPNNQPDRWSVLTLEHYCLNPDHKIIYDFGMIAQDATPILEPRRVKTTPEMLEKWKEMTEACII